MSQLKHNFKDEARDLVVYTPIRPLIEKVETLLRTIAEREGELKALTLQNAFLRQREDLPVDRIPAYQKVIELEKYIVKQQETIDVLSKGYHPP